MKPPPPSGLALLGWLITLTIKGIWLALVGICWALSAVWKALITDPGNRKHEARRAAAAEAHRRACWDAYWARQAWERQQAEQAAWWAHSSPGWQPDAVSTSILTVDDIFAVPAATDWQEGRIGNTDEGTECWFCAHAKSAHEDDYACAYPDCSCETEQYSRPPVWHAGDPMQFRDLVVDLDGTVGYEKVLA